MEEVKQTISKVSKNVNPGFVENREGKDLTVVIRASLSLIFAARAHLKYGDFTNS